MEFDQMLSVITPVSKPELLPIVGLSIPKNAEWILVTDGPLQIPQGLRPHTLIEGPQTNQWGDVQRQIGLEVATRLYIYFLDDDNLMLPSLPTLLIPMLEAEEKAGVLFGILVDYPNEIHLWPPPLDIVRGRVDTGMFLGRREAILNLHFQTPVPAKGWPNLQGERYANFVFIKAFDEAYGLSRLTAIYGYHNAIRFFKKNTPQLFSKLESGHLQPKALIQVLNTYMIAADVPTWW
jgi:hypothetical protein